MPAEWQILLDQVWLWVPAYLPLGVVGLWRWSVWGIKRIMAQMYRPDMEPHAGAKVAVVTPVYNEDPVFFRRALESWRGNGVDEVVAVIDYSDEACIEVFKRWRKEFRGARLIVTKKPGKRPALADGIEAATGEIVALVDSDTWWEDGMLDKALCPFNDNQVAGVTVRQSVLNPVTLAQRLFNSHLNLRYLEEFPYLTSIDGSTVQCLSGRTAIYRRAVLLPLLPQLVYETFWGKPVISGEDKRLTYLVEAKGWKTKYQGNARVYTPGEETVLSFLKQRLRWTRNSWRSDMRALTQRWTWRKPYFAFHLIDRAIQPFTLLVGPIYFVASLALDLWWPAVMLLVWWHVSRVIRLWPHLRRRPQDVVIVPAYVLLTFYTGLQKIYALFTMNRQGWITRWDKGRLNQATWVRLTAGYVATSLVIFAMTGTVLAYKQDNLAAKENILKPDLVGKYIAAEPVAMPALVAPKFKVGEEVVGRYEVVTGDTVASVAAAYGVGPDEIVRANAAGLPTGEVQVGQVLSVPISTVSLENLKTYRTDLRERGELKIWFNQEVSTIEVEGRGQVVTWRQIAETVGPEYIEEWASGEWYLKNNLRVSVGVTVRIEAPEVTHIKMRSDEKKFVWIRTSTSQLIIDGVNITSWDEEKGGVDEDMTDGRSFLVAKYGSRMDVLNSSMGYLGYVGQPIRGSSYGVSWKIPEETYGQYLLTGHVINSRFHHNYFGGYTFGALGMVWRGNEFDHNVRYGLDPHDDSNYFLVENNVAHENGAHGIIFSKRCVNNVIRGNELWGNELHGIMLHDESNDNLVADNFLHDNTDGITVYNGHGNVIIRNSSLENEQGVRINAGSSHNWLKNNRMIMNAKAGVRLYEGAGENWMEGNKIVGSRRGLYIDTERNVIQGNVIDENYTGIFFGEEGLDNTVQENRIINSERAEMARRNIF